MNPQDQVAFYTGYFHIVFNIIVQLVLGIPLEMVHRWWRIFTCENFQLNFKLSNFVSILQGLNIDFGFLSHT
jgi:hypothetical protein